MKLVIRVPDNFLFNRKIWKRIGSGSNKRTVCVFIWKFQNSSRGVKWPVYLIFSPVQSPQKGWRVSGRHSVQHHGGSLPRKWRIKGGKSIDTTPSLERMLRIIKILVFLTFFSFLSVAQFGKANNNPQRGRMIAGVSRKEGYCYHFKNLKVVFSGPNFSFRCPKLNLKIVACCLCPYPRPFDQYQFQYQSQCCQYQSQGVLQRSNGKRQ